MGAAHFFSPWGRRSRQRDEGASSPYIANVSPSSDPSGHLLPLGEKKHAAPPRQMILGPLSALFRIPRLTADAKKCQQMRKHNS
ncbi:hypothetical protein AGR7A_Lc20087 [Agrobacterium deltaense NCPPB 1641]|uniref:Uncharacterized protein n=1 Tax=Agrobacterium deltaense NCPPB 1641 TaxID=1183425 RepID=A0A1S7U475_9HYPH|nr:hypothetical protein AGR7A_Lc20087 [Agrobacterium deltaense NCPPB 1641]